MGLFDLFKKKQENPEDIDYLSIAEDYERSGEFPKAIEEYEKAIIVVFPNKEPRAYRHITKRIIDCYLKMGNHEKVVEMWPQKYDSSDYGAKEMYDLIKILENVQRMDLVAKVYDRAGSKLAGNRIEFLIKQKKIPEANALITEIISQVSESNPSIIKLWTTKAKLCLSLKKWDEACKYLNKIIEKDTHNLEARKLKEFCLKQVRSS